LGRFKEACAATEKAFGLANLNEFERQALRSRLSICQQLAPLENRLSAILAGKDQPTDVATLSRIADWCLKYARFPATAVRLFEGAFATQPSLAENVQSQDRFRAACAAAQAGCGFGDDAPGLTDQERTELRKKSFQWLRADRDAWRKRSASDLAVAVRTMNEWQGNDDLACVRDPAALAKLPESERKEWQSIWVDVRALASLGPRKSFEQARSHVDHNQWAKASELYSPLLKENPGANGEFWFECAAVQLLSEDLAGYRQTCKLMLDAVPTRKMRAYLASRACTLAPDSVPGTWLTSEIISSELNIFEGTFWSLSERGAISCREGHFKVAVELFEKSLRAEAKPGAAVLNWLWLAIAHFKLGETDDARFWLKKADAWLDSVGNDLPASANSIGLHRHNWLEAHVLRREAEALLQQISAKQGAAKIK
jgi:tetratricopeptide (TPR) repeat protein